MGNREKDERKARGGTARSLALSPERRKEIAQKAALSRWGPPKTTAAGTPLRMSATVRMLKGIPALKRLTVTSDFAANNSGYKTTVIAENGSVLRTFVGHQESVEERVQSYLAALQDLGIELVLSDLNVNDASSSSSELHSV